MSRGGVPKRAVPEAMFTETGIEGDAWRYPFHGGPRKAVLLITAEGIAAETASWMRAPSRV